MHICNLTAYNLFEFLIIDINIYHFYINLTYTKTYTSKPKFAPVSSQAHIRSALIQCNVSVVFVHSDPHPYLPILYYPNPFYGV